MRLGTIDLRRMLLASACISMLFALATCERDDRLVCPGLGLDPVYNADGGFVITQSMLDKPYNQITFPGTHNSFACPNWHDACANQRLEIAEQLDNGIRFIELDVDDKGCASHNGWCKRPLSVQLIEIRDYALAHPRQVITVRISDIACTRRTGDCRYITAPNHEWMLFCDWPTGKQCCYGPVSPEVIYNMINNMLESTGLDEIIYNWDASISDNSDPAKCYVPIPWPTLREMIYSRKNIMFFHHRDIHDIVDSGYFRGLDFVDYNDAVHHDGYASYQLADLSRIQPVWDPGMCERQEYGYSRLFFLECHARAFESCGVGYGFGTEWVDCPKTSRSCNDGRRHFQLAKQHEEDIHLLPGDRVVNFITVDYYMSMMDLHYFRLPINVVDACNRLNYERFGLLWNGSYCAWELQPYEFDKSKIEHIQRIPALKEEVDNAISDFQTIDEGLHGYEEQGGIVSTPVYEQCAPWESGPPTDWLWLPEWAVDGDYYTAWRGVDWGGSLGIDLGAAKKIDEIAIAWMYTHMAPGYDVYASDTLEGDFHDALNGSGGWTLIAHLPARSLDYPKAWDRVTFDLNSWRYIKIELTQPGWDLGSAIFELRVYGPVE